MTVVMLIVLWALVCSLFLVFFAGAGRGRVEPRQDETDDDEEKRAS